MGITYMRESVITSTHLFIQRKAFLQQGGHIWIQAIVRMLQKSFQAKKKKLLWNQCH